MLFQSRSFCGNDQKDLQTDLFEQKQIWSRIQKQNQFLIFPEENFPLGILHFLYTNNFHLSQKVLKIWMSKRYWRYNISLPTYLCIVPNCVATSFWMVCDQTCSSVRPNRRHLTSRPHYFFYRSSIAHTIYAIHIPTHMIYVHVQGAPKKMLRSDLVLLASSAAWF